MKAVRNSSFELLRIILILMILMEHANMWFIGYGYQSEPEHFAKCVVETFCVGAVNAFILISGWFGIKDGMKKIGWLVFMMLSCTIPILIVALLSNLLPLSTLGSFKGIYDYVLGGEGYWFVVDYIGLVIVSPLLNSGIDNLNKKQLGQLLILGYVLIAIYDFFFRVPVLGAEGGYSVLWFCYLYLLARYIRLYKIESLNRYRWIIYISVMIAQTVLFYEGLSSLRYTNPLILTESVCLILIFSNWNIQNKTINLLSTGALMAYLLHMQPILIPYISSFLSSQYVAYGYGLYMIEALALSVVVYLVAVLFNNGLLIIYNKIKLCLSR